MIRLEHLNLVVRDMDETLSFYQAAFPHWRVRGGEPSSWYGIKRNWLHFGDDYNYLTFNDHGHGQNRDLTSNDIGLSHFAFVTSNVDALVARLERAGFTPDKVGKENRYRKNVYFIDPNGYEIEFVEYLSDVPIERNNYEYQNTTQTNTGREHELRNPSWYF